VRIDQMRRLSLVASGLLFILFLVIYGAIVTEEDSTEVIHRKLDSTEKEEFEASWLLTESDFNAHPVPTADLAHYFEHQVRNFKSRGSDGEHVDALHHFFYNKVNGTCLELGAVDGNRLSETKAFVPLGYRRILVEASPDHRQALSLLKHTFAVNAAICEPGDVGKNLHYARNKMVSGLVEYFSERQLQKEFSALFSLKKGQVGGAIDYDALEQLSIDQRPYSLTAVRCLTLASILKRAGVAHVDFFVLDTEGSELAVLKGVDWERTTFDVLAVETESDGGVRSTGFAGEMEDYLRERGYSRVVPGLCGRNSWFVRDGFVSSRAPFVRESCYRGANSACRMRQRKETVDYEARC
jgi:hypothetical protein